MSPASASSNGSRSDAELRAAARRAYRESLAAQQPVSGTELARRFEMSESWGQARVREVREEATKTRDRNAETRDDNARDRDADDPGEDMVTTPRDVAQSVPMASGMDERDVPVDHGGEHSGRHGGRSWLDAAITLVVAVVAAAASYGHMLHVATLAGEPLWIARAFPVTVDGLVLAALRRGKDGRGWLALGAAVSVAANVLAQFPEHATTVGPVVSAWPPIALYGTHRLLQGRNDDRSEP